MDRQPAVTRHGVVVLDKPAGLTSAHAVEAVMARLRAERAGHGGTLDPIATGVLAIAINSATKLASFMLADDKAYIADARLGTATDTLDRTGAIVEDKAWAHVTREALAAACAARVGEHDQVPPMYSAIKIGGVPLHERARAGEDVPRAARQVRIDRCELLAFDPPHFRVAIACGKGTYVRSLLADLAGDVGTVAHMTELRRTRAGRFAIEDAVPLDALTPDTPLLPLVAISGLPSVEVPDALLRLCRSAVQIDPARLGEVPPAFQLVTGDTLIAIAHVDAGKVIYDRVFPELASANPASG